MGVKLMVLNWKATFRHLFCFHPTGGTFGGVWCGNEQLSS